MPSGLGARLEKHFGTRSLYIALGLPEDKNPAGGEAWKDEELKRAYRKQSLKVHPDRVSEEDRSEATEKFQVLSAAYKLLSTPDRRAAYDETGEIDEDDDSSILKEEKDWDMYWRHLFKKVSLDDIANFEKEYKGSEEELADLKQAYLDGKGDMNFILDNVLCSTLDDEPRFVKILNSLIKEGSIPNLAKFSKESAKSKATRKRRLEGEKMEAEEAAKELGMNTNDENSLRNMIMKRQQSREKEMDGFFDHLAAKYGGGDAKKKTKKGKK